MSFLMLLGFWIMHIHVGFLSKPRALTYTHIYMYRLLSLLVWLCMHLAVDMESRYY